MSTSVLRTADAWWVQTPAGAARIDTAAAHHRASCWPTGRPIAAAGRQRRHRAASSEPRPGLPGHRALPGRRADDELSPRTSTTPAWTPRRVPLTFFRKSSGSISGPYDDVIRPGHVRLLDYEVEIGLVIGREMPVGTTVTEDDLADYVAGLVVTNDVSARDLQLTKTQFYEAKSYPTFTPVGPALVLLDADELKRLHRPAAAAVGQRRAPAGHDRRRHDLPPGRRRCRR